MEIKDLEIRKELAGAELAAVRGGFNFGAQLGSSQTVGGPGSILFASPVIQVNPQTLVQLDLDNVVDLTAINNIGGILNSAVAQ
jgi:hypothetical protein